MLNIMVGIGVYKSLDVSATNSIANDAASHARQWSAYLSKRLPDFNQLLNTGKASEEQLHIIKTAHEVGNIFKFKVYDPDGKEVLSSAHLKGGKADEETEVINQTAIDVFRSGQPVVEIEDGTQKPNRPDVYAEIYVPYSDANGQLAGVVEFYMDQTQIAANLRQSTLWATLAVLLLGALASMVPTIAFWRRNSQATRAEGQLSYLAEFDALTGALSRQSFTDQLNAWLAQNAHTNNEIAVVFIDVDDFKAINDEFGHEGGDAFLKHVANSISAAVRPTDLVARFGGDEFLVAFPRITNTGLELLCRRILRNVRQPAIVNGVSISGQISMGAQIKQAGTTTEDLLREADVALYKSKQAGKNRFMQFHEGMNAELRARRQMEARLHEAYRNNEFELNFQPLVDSVSRNIQGFEALLRLPDGNGGYIPPDEFIPIAEDTSLIGPITEQTLEQAIEVAKTWPSHMFVAVNLSPRQFESNTLVPAVETLLDKTRFPAHRLELEVTETLFLGDARKAGRQIRELQELGLSIALDDFGIGYSSLSYLLRYGFNKLKIDRSFLIEQSRNPEKLQGVLKTIIDLGQKMDMRVTAEGIETDDQADMLSRLGCDLLQGYRFGKPMPAEEIPVALLQSAIASEQQLETRPHIRQAG